MALRMHSIRPQDSTCIDMARLIGKHRHLARQEAPLQDYVPLTLQSSTRHASPHMLLPFASTILPSRLAEPGHAAATYVCGPPGLPVLHLLLGRWT